MAINTNTQWQQTVSVCIESIFLLWFRIKPENISSIFINIIVIFMTLSSLLCGKNEIETKANGRTEYDETNEQKKISLTFRLDAIKLD